MPLTNYGQYARDLACTLEFIRGRPAVDARVRIAICRNSHGIKSLESYGVGRSREATAGPLSSTDWTSTAFSNAEREMASFFALPEIYAYSSEALITSKDPTLTPHWNAVVALFDICFHDGGAIWEQRMMFAGFADFIHAEFFITAERNALVHDNNTGQHFFEWSNPAY